MTARCTVCDSEVDASDEAHELRQQTCTDCLTAADLVVTGAYTKPITDEWLIRLAPLAVRESGLTEVRRSWEDLITEVHRHRRKARNV